MTKLPWELQKGDKVGVSENNWKEVSGVEAWLPECLAETKVKFTDGTFERYCNQKNLVVVPRKTK